MARCHRFQLGQDLRDVPHRIRKRSGPLGVFRVVAQQVAIFLHSRTAAGSVDYNGIYSPGLKRIDQATSVAQSFILAPRMNTECAAAALRRWCDNIASLCCKNTYSSCIDAIKEYALHTAQQPSHSP